MSYGDIKHKEEISLPSHYQDYQWSSWIIDFCLMDTVSAVNNSQIFGLAAVELRTNPHHSSCCIWFHICFFHVTYAALLHFFAVFCPFHKCSQLSIKCNFLLCIFFSNMSKKSEIVYVRNNLFWILVKRNNQGWV